MCSASVSACQRTSTGHWPRFGASGNTVCPALFCLQLATVEAYTEDVGLRNAILRAYAVQAIAAFANEGG